MTERDWEAAARRRLEHVISGIVTRMRDSIDLADREAVRNLHSAAQVQRSHEFHTYPYIAGQFIHNLQTMLFNLNLPNLIDAAADAEAARVEKIAAVTERTSVTAEADRLAGATKALVAVQEAAKGWAQASAFNSGNPVDEQEFMLADILNMIDDAAREVGVAPVYGDEKR